MRSFIVLVVLLFGLAGDAGARGLLGHANAMRRAGRIWHDRNRGGGSEVVAFVGRGIGQVARAKAAWRRSAPHASILRQRGWLRVWCSGGYCAGRK